MSLDITGRHPSTQAALRRLEPNSNLSSVPRDVADKFYVLGLWLVEVLPDDPDLADGLRKLWEAKNCVVYVAVRPPAVSKLDGVW
jgi:hypothetical protein